MAQHGRSRERTRWGRRHHRRGSGCTPPIPSHRNAKDRGWFRRFRCTPIFHEPPTHVGSCAKSEVEVAGRRALTPCRRSHATGDELVPCSAFRSARTRAFGDACIAVQEILDRNHGSSETTRASPSPCVTYQGCDEGYPVTWCARRWAFAPTLVVAARLEILLELLMGPVRFRCERRSNVSALIAMN